MFKNKGDIFESGVVYKAEISTTHPFVVKTERVGFGNYVLHMGEPERRKTMESDLSKVEVGDWVLVLTHGWCRVSEILDAGIDPIVVSLDREGRVRQYDIRGRYFEYDPYPTCFPIGQVPKPYLDLFGPPPVEFKDGEPCWVSDDGEHWYPRVFKFREKEGFRTYGDYNVHALWKYCRKWESKP